MGYQSALQAAGANVLEFQGFGSYQGEWYALVEYNGIRGWVSGSFGSCSHCDAFEAEFGYTREVYDPSVDEYIPDPTYQDRMAAFGREYLERIMSDQVALNQAARDLSWDYDAEAMVKFIADRAKADGILVIVPKAKESNEDAEYENE